MLDQKVLIKKISLSSVPKFWHENELAEEAELKTKLRKEIPIFSSSYPLIP
jgi:hypothetical protein